MNIWKSRNDLFVPCWTRIEALSESLGVEKLTIKAGVFTISQGEFTIKAKLVKHIQKHDAWNMYCTKSVFLQVCEALRGMGQGGRRAVGGGATGSLALASPASPTDYLSFRGLIFSETWFSCRSSEEFCSITSDWRNSNDLLLNQDFCQSNMPLRVGGVSVSFSSKLLISGDDTVYFAKDNSPLAVFVGFWWRQQISTITVCSFRRALRAAKTLENLTQKIWQDSEVSCWA